MRRPFNKTYSQQLTNYDVVININAFLSKIGMTSITRNSKQEIVKANMKVKFFVMVSLAIGITITCVTLRLIFGLWKCKWTLSNYMDCIITVVTSAQVFIVIFYNNTFDIVHYKEYYVNYAQMDAILGIDNNEYYTSLKKKVNMMYFCQVFIAITRSVLGLTIYSLELTPLYILPFSNIEFAVSLEIIHMMYVVVKVYILHNKFMIFGVRLLGDLPTFDRVWNTRRDNFFNIEEHTRCYQMFCKQQFLLSSAHGWEVCLATVHFILSTTRYAYELVQENSVAMISVTYGVLSQVIMIGGLIIYVTSLIENMQATRSRILIQLDEVLACRELYLGEKSAVIALLKQMRRLPLQFSVCGMFNLNYRTLQIMFSLANSYMIIMPQL